jgi:hypothetical protein
MTVKHRSHLPWQVGIEWLQEWFLPLAGQVGTNERMVQYSENKFRKAGLGPHPRTFADSFAGIAFFFGLCALY